MEHPTIPPHVDSGDVAGHDESCADESCKYAPCKGTGTVVPLNGECPYCCAPFCIDCGSPEAGVVRCEDHTHVLCKECEAVWSSISETCEVPRGTNGDEVEAPTA